MENPRTSWLHLPLQAHPEPNAAMLAKTDNPKNLPSSLLLQGLRSCFSPAWKISSKAGSSLSSYYQNSLPFDLIFPLVHYYFIICSPFIHSPQSSITLFICLLISYFNPLVPKILMAGKCFTAIISATCIVSIKKYSLYE